MFFSSILLITYFDNIICQFTLGKGQCKKYKLNSLFWCFQANAFMVKQESYFRSVIFQDDFDELKYNERLSKSMVNALSD